MREVLEGPPPGRIAIVDPCSAAGYDLPDLETGGLGGTEATILRVACTLRPQFELAIYQAGRLARHRSRIGQFWPLEDAYRHPAPAVFVVINRWKVAVKLRKLHPDETILLWLHVYPGRHNRKMGAALKAANIEVICVSHSHAEALITFLDPTERPKIRVIYNPVDDSLHPDDTPRDPDRLIFASSPHKGLNEVFKQFATLRRAISGLRLSVADPGYLKWETGPVPEGVDFLGSLSHPALIRNLREALCLFYPQTSFAETFGLVLAEANAVGTPVLVHDSLGANAEVVADSDQRVDGRDELQILERIEMWRREVPRVTTNPDFRMRAVAENWTALLSEATAGKGGSGRRRCFQGVEFIHQT